MNDEHLKQQITVMQHFLNGGEIECARIGVDNAWTSTVNPSWNWYYYQYRIKPAKPITLESEDITILYKLILKRDGLDFSLKETVIINKLYEKCKQSLPSYSS